MASGKKIIPLFDFVFFPSSETGLSLHVSLKTHRSLNTNDQMSELSTSTKNRDKNSFDQRNIQ